MTDRYAILVDGGFVKRKLGSRQAPVTPTRFKELIDELQQCEPLRDMQLHRVYYYDAPPLDSVQERPLQGGSQDFGSSALASVNRRLLHGLARIPYMALRVGELVFRGWQVRQELLQNDTRDRIEITSEDLVPVIHQRGVDIRLALDLAALTLKRQVQVIVLVAGDSDYVPAMKFARSEGCQLFLVTLGHVLKEVLVRHADVLVELPSVAKEQAYGEHPFHDKRERDYAQYEQHDPSRYGQPEREREYNVRGLEPDGRGKAHSRMDDSSGSVGRNSFLRRRKTAR